MSKARSVTFGWQFAVPVDRIWSVLADTPRFSEAAGFPAHVIERIPQTDGSVNFVAHADVGPLSISWDDEPPNWVVNRWFRHCRRFRNGPFKYFCVTFRLRPNGGGSHGEFTVEVEPANPLGRLLLGPGSFKKTYKKFTRLFADAEAYCEGWRDTQFEFKPPSLTKDGARLAAALAERIESTARGHDLGHRLAEFVTTRPKTDVATIRPLTLARLWDVPERHAIEVCLEAVREGLLGRCWSLLCPRCQAGREKVAMLKELPAGAHCATCNMDFKLDLTQNVELVFFPSTAIRPLDDREYSLMGPMGTPHILAQLTLAPGEQRIESVQLTPNATYRVRTLEPGDECNVTHTGGSFPEAIAEGDTISTGGPVTVGMVAFINRSHRRLTFILEELTWRRDALLAGRAATFQAFRDLFKDDVLRPGENIEIKSMCFLFSGLEGSTAMCKQIGDTQAYSLAREYFDILSEAIREHDGGVVKKIGDAVMAVFFKPIDALNCAIRVQHDIHWFNETSDNDPVVVKLGLHNGGCLSVNMNDRLDYYGSTVNMAAVLRDESSGGDIVLSMEFAGDPEVVPVLETYSPAQETARPNGFRESVQFWRIPASEFDANRNAKN